MIENILILLAISFVARSSPGPDMVLLIKNSIGGCRATAFACLAGILLGITVHVAAAILGIALVIATSTLAYEALKIIGALYLIYIGVKSIRSAHAEKLIPATNGAPIKRIKDSFIEGLMCNLLNPKFIIFLLSVFTQFISPDTPLVEKTIYGGTLIFEAAVGWAVFVLLIQTKTIQSFLQKQQVRIQKIMGIGLISFGAALALKE